MNTNLLKAILGKLLVAYAVIMCMPALTALYYQESAAYSFLGTAGVTGAIGFILLYRNSKISGRMGLRESYTIVGLGWLLASLLGAIPFLAADIVLTYTDAVFETVSGFTTTGASVLNNLEALPQSILLWRSMTHWLGGMGIIVLFIVLLPNMGMGAVHLFNAEVPGPTAEKIMPRIRKGALFLWVIYTGFTFLETVLLIVAGMPLFDALNHAMATMATGGFSTRTASIAAYDSLGIELIIVIFMIIAGVNFNLYVLALRRGLSSFLEDLQFKVYLGILLCSTGIIACSLLTQNDFGFGTALRQSLFQVTSIMTTTGFATADYDLWPALAKMVLFVLMFIGGSAGSTSGGIKVARIILLLKMCWAQIKQTFNPNLVVSISFQGRPVDAFVLNSVGRFFFLFLLIFAIASVILAGTGLEPFDAMASVVAMLGNIGPGFGVVGPILNYADIAQIGKVILIACMLLGRLELFTILVLTQPEFWQKRMAW